MNHPAGGARPGVARQRAVAVAVDVPSSIQLLRSCSAVAGRQLHQLLLKSGHVPSSLPPTNSVLLMYARGSPLHSRDARRLFDLAGAALREAFGLPAD